MCVVVLSRLIKYGMALLRSQSLTEILLIFNLLSQKTVNRIFHMEPILILRMAS